MRLEGHSGLRPTEHGSASPDAALCSRQERGTGCTVEPCGICEARAFSICESLADEHLGELARAATVIEVPARHGFVQEGERQPYVFNVTSGAVKLSKLLPDGRRQILGFLCAGDFVGFGSREAAGFTAEALTETRLCRFPRARFDELLRRFPALERKLLERASHEITVAQEQMLLLGRKTAKERVASFLLGLARAAERIGRTGPSFHLPMSRAEIADYLGLTIETVSRTFTLLRKEGWVSLGGADEVTILDRPGLRRLAEGG